jgi:hypothetical protein
VEKVVGSKTIDYLYSLDGQVISEALPGGGWNAGYRVCGWAVGGGVQEQRYLLRGGRYYR